MHDIMLIQNFKCLYNLGKICQSHPFWELSFLFQKFLESATIAELINKIEVVGCFEHIEIFDDVGAWLQVGEDVDLVVGALL